MTNDTNGKCPFGFGSETPQTDAATIEPSYASRHAAMPSAMSRDQLPELVKDPVEPGADGLRTGRCLCGNVSFQIKSPVGKVFANHDVLSRRRSGGVAMTIMVRAATTAFHGWGRLVSYPLSEHEVSCFCRTCGTPVLVRYLQPEAMQGMISLSAGTLDDSDGLQLAADICSDEKPDYYAFEGERRGLPSEEVRAMFARPDA
ncbi:MAG: GFA family protein [Paracoccaceae bacterium]|nr:GFA family protein [Paracoccaceae bacterium]